MSAISQQRYWKKFSLQQKHHLDVHFYKGNNCQAKSMIVLPGVKWTDSQHVTAETPHRKATSPAESPLNICCIIILFTIWAWGPELHCKYTCYIIARLEKKYFWTLWQINTMLSLWSKPYLAPTVTHINHNTGGERGGQTESTTIPECSSSYLPSNMDREAEDGQQILVHSHPRSPTVCLMSAQNAQRVKRHKPSADGESLSVANHILK